MRIVSQLLPQQLRHRLRNSFDSLYSKPLPDKVTIGVLSQWTIVTRGLRSDSVIYSGGVGEDITFEQELIRRFGVKIHIFDPAPVAAHTIALANTDNGSPINVIHKMTGITVPLKLTIFQPYSWLSVIIVLALLALAIWRMEPQQSLAPDPAVFEDEDQPEAEPEGEKTFAEWLENLWILNVLMFGAGIAYFCISGFALNISSMIMLFTITSALLHRTPIRFIRAFTGAAKVSGPLLLQYPLYGGLVGLLGYLPSQPAVGAKPLQTLLAQAVVGGATQYTLPFLTFIGSLIISLFVPSGGGHWAVQGPIAVDSALALGQRSPAYLGLISMAVAVGEGVANMIQPFWLLPLLAIAKLNVRQVMGFTIVAFVIGLVVLGTTALIAPYVI